MDRNNQPTVELINVSKAYGQLKAVDQLSFTAYRGEIFGLLGPNGAGKITTLEMIEGLRVPDSGEISIDGHNVKTDLQKVKEKKLSVFNSKPSFQCPTPIRCFNRLDDDLFRPLN